MQAIETYSGITEANSDWESGNVEIPAARWDYTRTSQEHNVAEGLADEANSDLGNLGRDVHTEETAPTNHS